MDEVTEILKNLDWSPLYISLKTGVAATVISFFLGIFAAGKAVKASPGKKAVLDGILTLPMVMPPTVAGFFLLLLFSRRRPVGAFLFEEFGFKVVQTWIGCVIAAIVISFPLMYRNARAAMEQIDVNLVYAGRTLGMSETKIFWKIVIPTARSGNCVRNNPDICKSDGRIWGDVYAGRKYTRKDGDDRSEDCDGHSGRRLCYGRNLGFGCSSDRFCHYFSYEFHFRTKDEKYREVVKDGD